MTSRERLLRTFRHEKPDRVPVAPFSITTTSTRNSNTNHKFTITTILRILTPSHAFADAGREFGVY